LHGIANCAKLKGVKDAEFWRNRKNEFRRLAESEYATVPEPADRRRLYAYGDYTVATCDAVGSWTLVGGLSADFRTSFEEAATTAGRALQPPPGTDPLQFWLHSLADFLKKEEQASDERGHLAVWEPDRGGVIRNVPAASAFYCSGLIKECARREPATTHKTKLPRRAVSRRATSDTTVERVRQRARRMIAEGGSHREVCQRLGNAPRPARTAWNHLPWDKAYKEQRFRSSVCKWLSQNCRP
jgi:hypothetical protein